MRECLWCDHPLPDDAHALTRYCSPACRNAANNAKAKTKPVAPDEHGRRVGYARGCRCEACRRYNADYSKRLRARAPKGPKKPRSDRGMKRGPVPHGTVTGYTFHRCRCSPCRSAKVADNAAWREANRDKVRNYFTAYRFQNPDKMRGYDAARIASPFDAEAIAYALILSGDPCCYCGAPSEHIDHIDPVSMSRNSRWDNLTAACARCNHRKGKKRLLPFLFTAA